MLIKSSVEKNWPLLAAAAVLAIAFIRVLSVSLDMNQGNLVYALDDAYIHMAMAKNFALHGCWGVTRYEFSSSSSSLLWTVLLAAIYRVIGPNPTIPLILNLICAAVILGFMHLVMVKFRIHPLISLLVLTSVIFFTPLLPLIFTGMEHTLHLLLFIIFIYYVAGDLSRPREESNPRNVLVIMLLAALLVMARYEGAFTIAAVVAFYGLRKRILTGGLVAMAGLLPVLIFGLISQSYGWFFLPNSLVLKSSNIYLTGHGIMNLITNLGRATVKTPHLHLVLLALAALLVLEVIKGHNIWERVTLMLALITFSAILHLALAKTGWFYRYEAYLMASGIFAVGLALGMNFASKLHSLDLLGKLALISSLVLFGGLLIASPIGYRGYISLKSTPQATNNIYSQQYQMGLFLRRYYQGTGIAANDIGAINYLADIKNLDLWGLGNIEVARARKSGTYNSRVIESLARRRGGQVAIVYSDWFDVYGYGGVPETWVPVGNWTIPNNVVCGRATVSFYAVAPGEKKILAANLREFSAARLPSDVKRELF